MSLSRILNDDPPPPSINNTLNANGGARASAAQPSEPALGPSTNGAMRRIDDAGGMYQTSSSSSGGGMSIVSVGSDSRDPPPRSSRSPQLRRQQATYDEYDPPPPRVIPPSSEYSSTSSSSAARHHHHRADWDRDRDRERDGERERERDRERDAYRDSRQGHYPSSTTYRESEYRQSGNYYNTNPSSYSTHQSRLPHHHDEPSSADQQAYYHTQTADSASASSSARHKRKRSSTGGSAVVVPGTGTGGELQLQSPTQTVHRTAKHPRQSEIQRSPLPSVVAQLSQPTSSSSLLPHPSSTTLAPLPYSSTSPAYANANQPPASPPHRRRLSSSASASQTQAQAQVQMTLPSIDASGMIHPHPHPQHSQQHQHQHPHQHQHQNQHYSTSSSSNGRHRDRDHSRSRSPYVAQQLPTVSSVSGSVSVPTSASRGYDPVHDSYPPPQPHHPSQHSQSSYHPAQTQYRSDDERERERDDWRRTSVSSAVSSVSRRERDRDVGYEYEYDEERGRDRDRERDYIGDRNRIRQSLPSVSQLTASAYDPTRAQESVRRSSVEVGALSPPVGRLVHPSTSTSPYPSQVPPHPQQLPVDGPYRDTPDVRYRDRDREERSYSEKSRTSPSPQYLARPQQTPTKEYAPPPPRSPAAHPSRYSTSTTQPDLHPSLSIPMSNSTSSQRLPYPDQRDDDHSRSTSPYARSANGTGRARGLSSSSLAPPSIPPIAAPPLGPQRGGRSFDYTPSPEPETAPPPSRTAAFGHASENGTIVAPPAEEKEKEKRKRSRKSNVKPTTVLASSQSQSQSLAPPSLQEDGASVSGRGSSAPESIHDESVHAAAQSKSQAKPESPSTGRKRKVNLIPPPTTKQEDVDVEDDNWGARKAAGEGADEAAEELERIMDPSPPLASSSTSASAPSTAKKPRKPRGPKDPNATPKEVKPRAPRGKKAKEAAAEKELREREEVEREKEMREREEMDEMEAAALALTQLDAGSSSRPAKSHTSSASLLSVPVAAHDRLKDIKDDVSVYSDLDGGSEASFSLDRLTKLEYLAANGTPNGVKKEGKEQANASASASASGKGKKANGTTEPVVLARRLIQLEEMQRKVWTSIARKDVPKIYRFVSSGYNHKLTHHKKLSSMIMSNAKRATMRTSKAAKDNQIKARRVTREMLLYWKKNEKEEGVSRKRAEKEAVDKAKVEEERRENARQKRKLEFLITQTELYSHFVGNKLKTSDLEKGPGLMDTSSSTPQSQPKIDITSVAVEHGEGDPDFDKDDPEGLTRHAAARAHEQVLAAKERAREFDLQREKEKSSNATPANDPTLSPTAALNFDSDELNFQNPTYVAEVEEIEQPKMLNITLKDYQLKGLRWLASLYEQGINGILADEMGLGKTVQSISVLAYLIETHNIWGPFLVIAPSSTLFNWQQELARFVPGVKVMPYWGNPKERALLRKFWSKKDLSYDEDASFHVLITSYQMVVQDAQYFQKVKWQYMILDEAQAIKSSSSARWKTLLSFSCRNRLLLTGTPIQNSMHELWALLHFIMPTLFDSHDEFSEWFAKDVEAHAGAETKGESNLNEHQIRRLHMILKPFMLRRIKQNVQNELGEKIEIDLSCDLSPRQRMLYRGLRSNISVADLLVRASRQGDADSARSLMNLVMQFRKVCNHPDLFQRAEVITPYAFCAFAKSPMGREKDALFYPDTARNPISYPLPRLFFEEGTLGGIPGKSSFNNDSSILGSMMNIWRTDWMAHSLPHSSSFAFLRLLRVSPQEAHNLFHSSLFIRLISSVNRDAEMSEFTPFVGRPEYTVNHLQPPGQIHLPFLSTDLDVANDLPPLHEISSRYWQASCLSRPLISSCRIPVVVAPRIQIQMSHRSFAEAQERANGCGTFEYLALYGLPPSLDNSLPLYEAMSKHLPGVSPNGLLTSSGYDQLPRTPTIVPEAHSLITDSAKLARLDSLLDELKSGGHRVLIYFQMTRMIDLMEEYMTFRKYRYLRLDGSSKLEDRRDMVTDWQTKPEIFVFLLSTRAGGLGINLTAADTVIFYDHDWNPSNDAQAMDRAHRLGQTRQVTVYRLITKGTIDERIVQLARVKKDVQDLVVGQKQFADSAKTNDIAKLLLNDDEIDQIDSGRDVSSLAPNGDQILKATQGMGNMWRDEGDDFFGASLSGQAALDAEVNDEIGDAGGSGAATPNVVPPTKEKKKRKPRGPNKKKPAGTTALGDNLPEDL